MCTSHVLTGNPFAVRRGFEPGLRLSGSRSVIRAVKAFGRAGSAAVCAFVVADEDELRVAAGDPDLDAPAVELAGELERRLAEGLLEAARPSEDSSATERSSAAVGGPTRLRAPPRGRGRRVVPGRTLRSAWLQYDIKMMSLSSQIDVRVMR